MSLYSFEGKSPEVSPKTYISPAAHLIGDVHVDHDCWIGPGAVIRADFGTIRIGAYSAVEENCVIHCMPDRVCSIGRYVTLGHGAMIHCRLIEDYASVGMGTVVSMDAVLRTWCVVGEGSLVKARQEIPAESIAVGSPARVIKRLEGAAKEYWVEGKEIYADLARRYLQGLKAV